MTATQAPTPGPLDSESVKLLVKGDLVGAGELIGTLKGSADGWGCATIIAPNGAEFSRILHKGFAFIGRPDADGWMPWSGGENPVPGRMVEVRWTNGLVEQYYSDIVSWRKGGVMVEAFRLAPTAPVEASGSEREEIAALIADFDPKNITPGAHGWHRNAADAVLNLRPQPSGETRELLARVEKVVSFFAGTGAEVLSSDESEQHAADLRAILALLSARPLAVGGQQGASGLESVSPEGLRARANMVRDALNDGGSCARHLELAAAEIERLSTTPARAEAQDEGAAGEPVAWDSDVLDTFGGYNQNVLTRTPYVAKTGERVRSQTPLFAHPSPTPAADADRVRIAVEAKIAIYAHLSPDEQRVAATMELCAWRTHCASQYMNPAEVEALDIAIAALKSEGK